MINWSYDEGSIRWQSEMTSCHGVALFTEKVYDVTEYLRGRCSTVIVCRRHQWTKSMYMHTGLGECSKRQRTYMYTLNNNFNESMHWNTTLHCQPNLSTYGVDCFESVSSISTVNKLFIYQYLWPVVSTSKSTRFKSIWCY